MTQASYLQHRAAKRGEPAPNELALLDRDLAEAGIATPPHSRAQADVGLRHLVYREMKLAMRAA